ncbi:MAG: hypothetical protein NVV63_12975 [Opitutus sp.]|nr:hypothetical protein [Opitutus sp.]
MTPERLAELQRQRALVQEQLTWLDREIAACQASTASAPAGDAVRTASHSVPLTATGSAAPRPATVSTRPVLTSPPLAPLPDLQPDPLAARRDTRRGCFIAFALALAIFFGTLVAIYFWKYRDRPLFRAESAARA